MAVIKMKPTSPGQRAVVKVTRDHLYKGEGYAPLLEPQFQKAGETTMDISQLDTRAVVTSTTTAWLISVATKMRYPLKSNALNMIRTGQHILHCFAMQMGKDATSSLQEA